MSSSVHEFIDNKGKDILVLGKGPTQRLDDTTLTARVQYSFNFPRSNRRFDYKTFDTTGIINIHKYLMKKHDIKECLH